MRPLVKLTVLLALVVLGAWWLARGDDRTEERAPVDVEDARSQRAELPSHVSSPLDTGRVPATTETRSTASSPRDDDPERAARRSRIAVRVLGENDVPLRGVHVALTRTPIVYGARQDRSDAWPRGPTKDTDEQGWAMFPAEAGREYFAEAWLDRGVPVRTSPTVAGCDLVLRFRAPTTLRGRVLLGGPNPTPIAGARIVQVAAGTDEGVEVAVSSDGTGEFVATGIVTDFPYFEVSAPNGGFVREEIQLAPGGSIEHDFVVSPKLLASGRVLDASTGFPVAGAMIDVATRAGLPPCITTGDDGRYAFLVLDERGFPVGLRVRARSYGECVAVVTPNATGAAVDIELDPERVLRGRIVDAHGTPIAGATVTVRAGYVDHRDRTKAYSKGSYGSEWRRERSGDDGRFEVRGLQRRNRHSTIVHREGFGLRGIESVEGEEELAVVDLGDVVLEASASIVGRVRSEVTHVTSFARYSILARPLVGVGFDGEWSTDRARSTLIGDDGRFVLTDLAPGTYALSTTREDPPIPAVVIVEVSSGVQREVELVVHDDAPFRGRVITTLRTPVAGASLRICDVTGVEVTKGRSVADGAFALRGVQPGACRVVVVGDVAWPPGDRRVSVGGTFDLVAGGDHELELVVDRLQDVAARVLDALGNPVAGVIVRMRVEGEATERSVTTGGEGFAYVKALRFGANARVSVLATGAPASGGTAKLGPPLVTIDWTVGEDLLVLRLP